MASGQGLTCAPQSENSVNVMSLPKSFRPITVAYPDRATWAPHPRTSQIPAFTLLSSITSQLATTTSSRSHLAQGKLGLRVTVFLVIYIKSCVQYIYISFISAVCVSTRPPDHHLYPFQKLYSNTRGGSGGNNKTIFLIHNNNNNNNDNNNNDHYKTTFDITFFIIIYITTSYYP